jgi:hypothetical protein
LSGANGCRRRAALTVLALSTALAACGGTPPPPTDVAGGPPILLDVGSIDIEDRRQPLGEANFIDERRSDELAAATTNWLRAGLSPGGGSGSATAIIEQASLTERLLSDRTGGVLGRITNEPTWSLNGDLAVRVVLRNAAGMETGFASAAVSRTRTVKAGASVVDRDYEAKRLISDLLAQLRPALEEAVRQNLQAPRGA